jgi:5-methylcytosine-specific restriction endonuclease McrBC regulatory subunit McrC
MELATRLKGSGRVQKREPINLIEQEETIIESLTNEEAIALIKLGNDLSCSSPAWGGVYTGVESGLTSQQANSVISVDRHPLDIGWRIRVNNAVGVIGVNDLQINILPKIGIRHFDYIAGFAVEPSNLRFGSDRWFVSKDETFLPSVWVRFVQALVMYLRADLHRDYEEIVGAQTYIRGKLDIRAVALNVLSGRMTFPATYEELSRDNAVNRVLRAAAEFVSNAVFRAAENSLSVNKLSKLVTESVYQLAEAGMVLPTDFEVEISRLADHQKRAFTLAIEVLSGVGRKTTIGEDEVNCFLHPTPNVIEDGIRQILDENLGSAVSVSKKRRAVSSLYFNPDLVVELDSQIGISTEATGDVKYRIRKQDWPREVLLQSMGFAQVFSAKSSFFIDFGLHSEKCETRTANIRDVTYHHITWPYGETVDPIASAKHIVSELYRALFESEKSDAKF